MSERNSRELKQVSLRFRTLASQALRSHSDDARVNLRRLLAFVTETPLLREEVERAPVPSVDVGEMWGKLCQERDRLRFPDDPLEELGLQHTLLSEFAKPSDAEFWHICYWYGGSHDEKEAIREVLSDTCGRYTAHLRGVIEMALLESSDPAYDSRRVEVHVTGGTNQVNVAQDSARIEARQQGGLALEELVAIARELGAAAAAIARETGSAEAEDLVEVSAAVAATVESPKPSRFVLRTAMERLKLFAETVNTVGALAPYAARLSPLAEQLARRAGEWLQLVSA